MEREQDMAEGHCKQRSKESSYYVERGITEAMETMRDEHEEINSDEKQ